MCTINIKQSLSCSVRQGVALGVRFLHSSAHSLVPFSLAATISVAISGISHPSLSIFSYPNLSKFSYPSLSLFLATFSCSVAAAFSVAISVAGVSRRPGEVNLYTLRLVRVNPSLWLPSLVSFLCYSWPPSIILWPLHSPWLSQASEVSHREVLLYHSTLI